ncbi:hypothetical protein DM01DRAFT_1332264 [Hesseltinella vesiculosa]|uniref:Zn(2)-C6 fungal-type domain-containing protein n=1 Tax=Hesseltinella vesiculosa TaxID=101127 RepID=A0A1X2GUG1_9FUNG|nr:hypothetical protein DM01DRAFT_1332264 [Hesseltinella vesiculosa]
MTDPSTTSAPKSAAKPRKKKAARACVHCQKAHLTCDDDRPCQRCIKRGLADTCTDGARKKAKYLQDTNEATPAFSQPTSQPTTTPVSMLTNLGSHPNINPFTDMNGLDAGEMDMSNRNYGFGSSATNLEYSMLSNMLGSPINRLQETPTPSSPLGAMTPPMSTTGPSTPTSSTPTNPWSHDAPLGSTISNAALTTYASESLDTQLLATGLDTVLFSPDQGSLGSPIIPASPSHHPLQHHPQGNGRMSSLTSFGQGAVVARLDSPNTALAHVKRRNQLATPDMIYNRLTKPFSYADGYHYLINYVRQKMSREDLMRISRALALFRPSVLASMMNLTEDDLMFTEKCLQRTLLEYEKLISYSGTPTVVWRRTGEITLVGKEFSLLTQWSRDALLGKKTYIYELMSNPSAIEYWEKYSVHAFDNTDSAVYSSCILLSPTKRIVPCTFCFTIKRDIFDLPSVIIGNFLPILS